MSDCPSCGKPLNIDQTVYLKCACGYRDCIDVSPDKRLDQMEPDELTTCPCCDGTGTVTRMRHERIFGRCFSERPATERSE